VAGLTKKQRSLKQEIDEIIGLMDIEFCDIGFVPKESRTIHLLRVKDHLIRSAVVVDYTIINDHLDLLLCHYFFGKKTNFVGLWRTKKFQNFNRHVLEKATLIEKLEFARAFYRSVPNNIRNAIERINKLRNSLAHSFFPQNQRRQPSYQNHSIYSLDGFRLFQGDMKIINRYFFRRLYRD
jgi:predicted acetyltransferase